jgi:CHAD domain-containing protein
MRSVRSAAWVALLRQREAQPRSLAQQRRGEALRLGAGAAGAPAGAFHDWRKRTKYLGYQLRLLQPGWPKLIKAQRRAVKALQGLLGEDHDLAVLTDLLAELRPQGPTADEPLAGELALNREMRRQSELLRRRARHLGEIVYAEQPKALGKRLGVYWTEAQRAA